MQLIIKYLNQLLKDEDNSEEGINKELPENVNSLEDFLNWIDKDN